MDQYYTRPCNFYFGKNSINKNEFPKGKENNKEDEKDQNSALGSIGLKPKIVH